MPPLKLPKKGKSKQIHIDFASADSARASAPSSWTAEDWFDEGTRQEEQGERYQFGHKATRHYNNAVTCYAIVAASDAADFDSRYNTARVWHTLATDHLQPGECLEALEKARLGYREALAVLDRPDAHGATTARIDALFNLAQANVTLFDLLQDALVVIEGEQELAIQVASEARTLFVEVERLQRDEMTRFFGASGPSASEGDFEEDGAICDSEPSTTSKEETAVRATETIVTPRLIIDTLLESLRFDLALHDWTVTDAGTRAELHQSAVSAFARATALRSSVAGEAADLDFELAFAQATMLTTLSPDEAAPFIAQLAKAAAQKVDLLSLSADHLIESLKLPAPVPDLLATLSETLTAYDAAQGLLSSRLSPPKDIPAAHLPSLRSANLVAQSTVHLLAAELLSRTSAPIQPLAEQAANSVPPNAHTAAAHLEKAHALALSATAAPRSGLSLVISTSTASTSRKPALALARAPASVDPRSDLRTVSALRTALFALSRVRLRLDPSLEGLQSEKTQFCALWRALGLGNSRAAGKGVVERGSVDEKKIMERDAKWWLNEIEGDKVMEIMGPEAAQAEWEYWAALMEAF